MPNPRSVASLLATFFFAGVALPQEKMLQPSPELQKLNYFIGTWKTQADFKPSPFGPGGKFTSTDRYEWQKGSFFLIGHVDFASPMGEGVELTVMSFDPSNSAFKYESFSSAGEHNLATGVFAGDTWTWTAAENAPFKWRYIEKELSPKSFSIKFEGSQDGTTWATLMEGTSTKN